MNVVNFTPSVRVNNVRNNNYQSRNVNYQPSFKGVEKAASPKKAGPIVGIARKLYEMFYLKDKGCKTKFENGFVYTRKVTQKGDVIVSNQYNMWEKAPLKTIKDDYAKSIRTKIAYNPDKTRDVEIRDMHVPEHRVSVKYTKVADDAVYSGPVELYYGEKSAIISPEQKENLISEFQKEIDDTVGHLFDGGWSNLKPGELKKMYDAYVTSPIVIGQAILTSPSSLENQVKIVNQSIPYGIEAIFEKIGK